MIKELFTFKRKRGKCDKFQNVPLECIFIYKKELYIKVFDHLAKNLDKGEYVAFLPKDKVRRI
jgi:hypothetical protein